MPPGLGRGQAGPWGNLVPGPVGVTGIMPFGSRACGPNGRTSGQALGVELESEETTRTRLSQTGASGASDSTFVSKSSAAYGWYNLRLECATDFMLFSMAEDRNHAHWHKRAQRILQIWQKPLLQTRTTT